MNKLTVLHYEIHLKLYHDELVGYLSFGETETSQLYSLSELCNIINLWKQDALMGSFGIGTKLSRDATFELKSDL